MLKRVTHLVGTDSRRRHRCVVEDVRREVHRSAPRVVVVGKRARCLLDRYLIEAVRIEDAAGNLSPCHTVCDGDLEVLRNGRLHPVLRPKPERQRNDEEDQERVHVKVMVTTGVRTTAREETRVRMFLTRSTQLSNPAALPS